MRVGSGETVEYHSRRVNEGCPHPGNIFGRWPSLLREAAGRGKHPVRIAYLSTMAGYYGGEMHLASLAAGMAARGHEVLCVVRPGSRLAERLPLLGLPVRALPLSQWCDPWTLGSLSGLLRRQETQILHSHVPRDYYTATAATVGSAVVNVATRHQLHPIGAPLLKRPFLSRLAVMIAVSAAVARGLAANRCLNPDRIVVVPNGIVPQIREGSESPVTGPLRLACGAVAGDPVVGFVGRLCPTKGVETLLTAAALLRADRPRLKVCIIGEDAGRGRYLARLQRLTADLGLQGVVHFLGYRADAPTAAREFDVQVVPSLAEPFGLVTLEAMNQGRPVVATLAGGSPEIVRDGVEGFLTRPRDAGQLARRLDVLLDSPGLGREMGRRGRLRVATDFSLELMLDRTEAVYLRALDRSGRQAAASAATA